MSHSYRLKLCLQAVQIFKTIVSKWLFTTFGTTGALTVWEYDPRITG